jgi:hypothetical protein
MANKTQRLQCSLALPHNPKHNEISFSDYFDGLVAQMIRSRDLVTFVLTTAKDDR